MDKIQEAKHKKRKLRTKQLIELGGLVVKANLDNLKSNTLYGALLTLKQSLCDDITIKNHWSQIGRNHFDLEEEEEPIKVKFHEEPTIDIKTTLRTFGLKFNPFAKEWYGYQIDIIALKNILK